MSLFVVALNQLTQQSLHQLEILTQVMATRQTTSHGVKLESHKEKGLVDVLEQHLLVPDNLWRCDT